jgi:hypothetical protein
MDFVCGCITDKSAVNENRKTNKSKCSSGIRAAKDTVLLVDKMI